MRNYLLLFLLIITLTEANAQQMDSIEIHAPKFVSYFDAGIKYFKLKEYKKAALMFEKANAIDSGNARLHYYLGYSYSYMAGREAALLRSYNKDLCIKASDEMQKAIRLDSTFKAEIVLDPYSKITSDWGALALHYLYINKRDSAVWALREGKRRGGFSEFYLQSRKLMLETCAPNAVLFSYGDMNYMNLIYLQNIEHLRPDISVIDLGLIKTVEYQEYLKSNNLLDFEIPDTSKLVRHFYKFVNWSDTTILIPVKSTVRDFKWYYKSKGETPFYIGLNDLVFISFMTRNRFDRDIYFSMGTPPSEQQNLSNDLLQYLLVDKVNSGDDSLPDNHEFDELAQKLYAILPWYNPNSADETRLISTIRIIILNRVYIDWSKEGNKEHAVYLLKELARKLPPEKYPFRNSELEEYYKVYWRLIIDEY